jgi:hypothetical protein
MQSKNKASPARAEREHILRVQAMPCGVCEQPGPSEVHEIEQGLWFASIPLCPDCRRGPLLGLHGQRRAWTVRKLTELVVLANTVERLVETA